MEAALDPCRRALVRLSAGLAGRDPKGLREVLATCAEECETPEVEEVLLQSYLFLGYPVALNALKEWRRISGAHPPRPSDDDWEGWKGRGEEVCREVYGGQYARLRTNVRDLHPDLECWMVVEGYGKVLGRPGLDLAVRELCIGALLAVLGTTRQLYSHLRGALNAGASTEEVEDMLRVATEELGERQSRRVHEVWDRVRSRVHSPDSSRTSR
jgi:4-carboxymuconolactone decarboxylase